LDSKAVPVLQFRRRDVWTKGATYLRLKYRISIGSIQFTSLASSDRSSSDMDVTEAVNSGGDEALREKFHTALACVQRTIELYGFVLILGLACIAICNAHIAHQEHTKSPVINHPCLQTQHINVEIRLALSKLRLAHFRSNPRQGLNEMQSRAQINAVLAGWHSASMAARIPQCCSTSSGQQSPRSKHPNPTYRQIQVRVDFAGRIRYKSALTALVANQCGDLWS